MNEKPDQDFPALAELARLLKDGTPKEKKEARQAVGQALNDWISAISADN